MFENLVFSGGGVKGIAYVGVLEALREQGVPLENIRRIAGTSAGSIIASLLSVGFDHLNIRLIMQNFNFAELLDEPNAKIQTRDKTLSLIEEIENPSFRKGKALIVTIPLIVKGLIAKNRGGGLYDGDYFLEWIENTIELLTERFLTFSELHELAENDPAKYKDLYIVAINLTTKKAEIISHETHPDYIISDAVRCSMSIPVLFKPHQLYIKKNGQRLVAPGNHYYSDGGLTDNYLIDAFDDPNIIPEGYKQLGYNPFTLGFRLEDFSSNNELSNPSGLVQILSANFSTLWNSQYNPLVNKELNDRRTVKIDSLGIGTARFKLSKMEKEELIHSGKNGVISYFESLDFEKVYEDQADQTRTSCTLL